MFDGSHSAGAVRWPIVRIAPGGVTEVIVASDRFLPVTTHWVRRTVMCPGDGCELCEVLPARCLFYLAVVCASRPSILEMSSMSSSYFEQHCKLLHGGIQPGLVVQLTRAGHKSPVRSEVLSRKPGVQCVSVTALVSKVMPLYQLPCANPDEGFEAYELRLRKMVLLRASRERALLESRASGGTQSRVR